MCHAGIYPLWDLNTAKHYAKEFGHILSTDNFSDYLYQLYGNEPSAWSATLNTTERLRFICNAFTRMRFCHRQGQLNLNFKGTIADAPEDCYPWYAVPGRRPIAETIIFGHWAAIQGQCSTPNIYAIDTGCVWGGQLTALRVEDKQRFSVPGV